MIVTIHRLIDRLFAHPHAPRTIVPPPTVTDITPRGGIPDGYLDKLPPLLERAGDCHYTIDPVTRHFVEVPDPHAPEVRH